MDEKKKVVVIGDIFVDMTAEVLGFPEKGGRTYGYPITRTGGGTAGNIASGLARLGADTVICGGIGDDEEGRYLLEGLRKDGVNVDYIKPKEGVNSGVVIILRDESGERNIHVLVKGSAFEKTTQEDLDFLETLKPDIICLTGAVAGAGTSGKAVIQAAEKWKNRAKLYFDPNLCYPADAVPEDVRKETNEMAALCDVVLTGEVEMETLGLTPQKGQTYIVKSGKKGSKLLDDSGKEIYAIPATKHQAVDTTGAGDAFMAAFVTAVSENMEIREAMRFASVAAGISVTKVGARNMPQREEVFSSMEQYEQECKEAENK